jgi:hypothetical protein
MTNGSHENPTLTDNEARNAILHLFGATATLEILSPRYVIKKDGRFLGEGPDVLISIRNALVTYCEKTGENPTTVFHRALARYRQEQPLPSSPPPSPSPDPR